MWRYVRYCFVETHSVYIASCKCILCESVIKINFKRSFVSLQICNYQKIFWFLPTLSLCLGGGGKWS